MLNSLAFLGLLPPTLADMESTLPLDHWLSCLATLMYLSKYVQEKREIDRVPIPHNSSNNVRIKEGIKRENIIMVQQYYEFP
jgi:hypothetical protein